MTQQTTVWSALGLTPAELAKMSMNAVLIVFIAVLAYGYYQKDNAYITLVTEVSRNSTRLDALTTEVKDLTVQVTRLEK